MNEERNYTVSSHDMAIILNVMTYDIYADLYRRLRSVGINRRPSLLDYMVECNKMYDFESLSADAWQEGYDFIADLFDDNEANGTPCDATAMFQQKVGQVIQMLNNR